MSFQVHTFIIKSFKNSLTPLDLVFLTNMRQGLPYNPTLSSMYFHESSLSIQNVLRQ